MLPCGLSRALAHPRQPVLPARRHTLPLALVMNPSNTQDAGAPALHLSTERMHQGRQSGVFSKAKSCIAHE